MEGKLIKIKDNYQLYRLNRLSGPELVKGKLSLKNCQAIENGYDLDELAKIYSGKEIFEDGYDGLINPHTKMFIELAYIKGFQKALEILGDKKFDINEVVELSKILISNPIEKCGKTPQELVDAYVKSLQQTEWDVEIVMECCGKVYSQHCDGTCEHVKPLLDADGCLILKRK